MGKKKFVIKEYKRPADSAVEEITRFIQGDYVKRKAIIEEE